MLIGKLLLLGLALGLSLTWYGYSTPQSQTTQPQPQPVKEDIQLYYQVLPFGEAAMLHCQLVTSGYLCPFTGAGGGGHSYPD